VVMLHGNPTWSYYFRHLVLGLQDDYRCIVPDHIGMGLSEKPRDGKYRFTLEQRVDDLEVLLDRLNIDEKMTLVLHDWGGMIGMAYAARHPEHIKRLILLNTGAFHLPTEKSLPWQIAVCRLPIIGQWITQGLNAFCRGAVDDCVSRVTLSPKVAEAYLWPYNSWRNRMAVDRFIQDIPLSVHEPAYELISQVQSQLSQFAKCPTLLAWGMQDFVFDESFLNKWLTYLPNAQVHRFEDAGHYVLEDTKTQIVPMIREFLDKTAYA